MTEIYGSCLVRLPFSSFLGKRKENGGGKYRHLRWNVSPVATAFWRQSRYTLSRKGKGGVRVVVYLDGVIGLNFFVDLLLLLGVNRLAGFPAGLGRAAAGAMVGGGYAGACLLPGFRFLSSTLWRLVSLGIVTVTAFGMSRSAFRRGVLFVLLSMAMGGLVLNFDHGDFWGILFCGGVLAALCTLGFRGRTVGEKLVSVELVHGGQQHRFLALVDTGNGLKDPLTGESVMVLSPELGSRILGLPAGLLEDPVGAVCIGKGLRLIPYSAVGAGGMLAAMRCDSVRIQGNPAGNLVAFAPSGFQGREYQALTGGIYG